MRPVQSVAAPRPTPAILNVMRQAAAEDMFKTGTSYLPKMEGAKSYSAASLTR